MDSTNAPIKVEHAARVQLVSPMSGGGVGGALVRHGLSLAAADNAAAFLETSVASNVPYYERFGFRVVHQSDAPSGGPHVWFMRCDDPGETLEKKESR